MDYGTCTLTCIHGKYKWQNIEITGIICGGLCSTFPIILPDLPHDYPRANLMNISSLMYKADQQFHNSNKYDKLSLKSLYSFV